MILFNGIRNPPTTSVLLNFFPNKQLFPPPAITNSGPRQPRRAIQLSAGGRPFKGHPPQNRLPSRLGRGGIKSIPRVSEVIVLYLNSPRAGNSQIQPWIRFCNFATISPSDVDTDVIKNMNIKIKTRRPVWIGV